MLESTLFREQRAAILCNVHVGFRLPWKITAQRPDAACAAATEDGLEFLASVRPLVDLPDQWSLQIPVSPEDEPHGPLLLSQLSGALGNGGSQADTARPHSYRTGIA